MIINVLSNVSFFETKKVAQNKFLVNSKKSVSF